MVAQTRKIKADCGVEPGASGNCAGGALPGDAHAGLAADAVDILAEGDVDLGEHGRVGRGVEEVHTGRDLAPYVLQVDGDIETGCETVSDADSSTSIGRYREAAAVLDAERTVCGSGGRDP
jgi:hypothetical protein